MPADRDELGRPLFPEPPVGKRLRDAWALEAADREAALTAAGNTIGNFPTDLQTPEEVEAEIASHEVASVFGPYDIDASKRIYFFSNGGAGDHGLYDFYTADPTQRQLLVDTAESHVPGGPVRVSRDGTRIYYNRIVDGSGAFRIVGADLSTGAFPLNDTVTNEEVLVTTGGATYVYLGDVSPDGTKIAYSDDANQQIWIADIDGSNQTLLFDDTPDGYAYGPVFSQDGSKLFFERQANGEPDGYIMGCDIDGSNPHVVYSVGEVSFYSAGVDPTNGNIMALASNASRIDVFTDEGVLVATIDTSVISGNTGVNDATFAPDGMSVLFNVANALFQVWLDDTANDWTNFPEYDGNNLDVVPTWIYWPAIG